MSFTNTKLEEFNNSIAGKRIAIIGLGVSNEPLIDYMQERKAKLAVFDKRNQEKIDQQILNKIEKYKTEKHFGEDYLSNSKDLI